MGIGKLHIDQEEYDFFTALAPKEKIEFLHDAQSIGLDSTISKYISRHDHTTSNHYNTFNDLFQDTLHEEINEDIGRITITTMNNYIHLNSNSLALIRKLVFKLFDDGHIMMRNKHAKKLNGIDNLRYYRCYEIIGSGNPFCPN